MASYHASIKSGKRGQALEHSRYISREGKYLKKVKKDDLVTAQHGNLPSWAQGDPRELWKQADKNERKNGAVYREYEIALPRELTTDQQLALVKDVIAQTITPKPYQFAIHRPKAALGEGSNDHVHIMFSDRIPDEIPRQPEMHFRRYNPTHPERGGCRKDSGGRSRGDLKAEVQQFRSTVAELTNKHLERHGHSARVDHRSNKDRGLAEVPGKHLGQAKVRAQTQS